MVEWGRGDGKLKGEQREVDASKTVRESEEQTKKARKGRE